MCLSVCVVRNLLLIVKVLKFYKLLPNNFLSSYLYANVLFIHLCSDGGKEVKWLHLHRLRVVQDSPPSVHSAGRPPISQAMGEKQIKSFCFKLVAFKLFDLSHVKKHISQHDPCVCIRIPVYVNLIKETKLYESFIICTFYLP